MANIIKKISGVDLSGNTVIADAAVTNMYTDENGDLNIKTSTELGDTDDSKVVITSKEINLNADTVKINNTPLDASEIVNNFDILSDFTRDVEYAVTNHSARIDNIETSVSTLQDNVTTLTERVTTLTERVESLENTGILDYEPSWKEFFNTVEQAISDMNRTINWNNAAIQKIADHLNYNGIYETE